MTQITQRRMLAIAGLLGVAFVASGCELDLFQADCSWIDAPDMGGLVCLGVNVLSLGLSVIAILLLLAGLPGAIPT